MMKRLLVFALMTMSPVLVTASGPQAPLRFFEAIPGQQNSTSQSRPLVSSKDADIFLEAWATATLSDDEPATMKLPADPEARSKMLEYLFAYRAAVRATETDLLAKEELGGDIPWASRHGIQISNVKSLEAIQQKLGQLTHEQRLQYAQTLSGDLGQILLQGVLDGMPNADLALRFLIQNPNVVSPERRDTLIFKSLVKLSNDGLEDPSRNNTNLALVRKAASLLNFNSAHTICRAAANAARVDFPNNRDVQREYNEVMARGLIEMTKKNVDCRDYISTERLLFSLAALEEANLYGRGFFLPMIKKLERGEDLKSNSSPQSQVPNPTLSQCLIDKNYRDTVEVEFNKMEKAAAGSMNLFGEKTKGDCKLRVQVEKLKRGFKAYIVVENPVGATLFRFDQKFETIQQMKNAAIFGTDPTKP